MLREASRFFMKSSKEHFEEEVVPWLHRNIGFKRGTKADWTATIDAQPTRKRPDVKFRSTITILHNVHAVAFMLHFQDHIRDARIQPNDRRKAVACYHMASTHDELINILKWMKMNLPARAWAVTTAGNPDEIARARFSIFTEDAKLVLQLISPSKSLEISPV